MVTKKEIYNDTRNSCLKNFYSYLNPVQHESLQPEIWLVWDIQYKTIVNNKTGIPGESNSNTCRLGCISLNDNLHCPLSPTGLKSQEERQKEEICKFWNCESTSHYMLFVLHFIQCKRYNHFINLCPFQRIVTVWPPVNIFSVYMHVLVFQVTLLSFKVESEHTFVDFIRGG